MAIRNFTGKLQSCVSKRNKAGELTDTFASMKTRIGLAAICLCNGKPRNRESGMNSIRPSDRFDGNFYEREFDDLYYKCN